MLVFRISLIIFTLSTILSFSVIKDENSLTVEVTDVRNSNGEIHIGLYYSKEGYPYNKEICKIYRFKAEKDVSTYTINNIEAGYYAMAVYHDENDNKVCDTNFFGYPLEGYCFSNRRDIVDILPPSFEIAKVKVDGESSTSMKLIYKLF